MSHDTFRDENTALIIAIKTKCEELEELMNKVNSREMSLAKTNLEQASMWATKAIVLDNIVLDNEEVQKMEAILHG